MAVDGGLNLSAHRKLSDCVVSRCSGMMEAVTAVRSVIGTVPVIEIEIVKHGGDNQCASVSSKSESFVQLIAGFSDISAVFER